MCLFEKDHLDAVRLESGVLHGFEYEIVRQPWMGYRCGYIRVEPGHPWFGKGVGCNAPDAHWNDLPHDCTMVEAEVHRGVSYAARGVACPTHGEEAEWWIGFDCGHAFDARELDLMDEPARQMAVDCAAEFARRHPEYADYRELDTIKDTDYVRAECASLALQALQAARAVEAAS